MSRQRGTTCKRSRRATAHHRSLRYESLEDRRMLAIATVVNNTDVVNGDTSSIAALNADPGPDGISLREAVVAANNTPGKDDVNFAIATPPPIITLSGIDIDVTDSVTINGPGAGALTVTGGNQSRIFNVLGASDTDPIEVEIIGLTLTEGLANQGGAVRVNNSVFVMDSVSLFANVADEGAGLWIKVGALATADLFNVTMTSNSTSPNGEGGGFFADVDGTFTIQDSLITGNNADQGGGGYFQNQGITTFLRNTVAGNRATSDAGGLYIESGGDFAKFTIQQSTIDGNRTEDGNGGGMSIGSVGDITIDASTISGNVAGGAIGVGGGIYHASGGDLTITNSTISNNTGGSALDSSGPGTTRLEHSTVTQNVGGGIRTTAERTLTIDHTLVAQNGVDNDITSAVTANFSLIGTDSGATITGSNNIVGSSGNEIDPMLGPLRNNGGPTATHAVLAGSPAAGAGDPNFIGPPDADQRGFPFERVAGERIDIGAYESDQKPTVTVTSPEDDSDPGDGVMTFREAVNAVVGNPDGAIIVIGPSLTGQSVLLENGEIVINGPVDIIGPGADQFTIDAQFGSRIFYIDDGDDLFHSNVNISGVTIFGGGGSNVPGDNDGGGVISRESTTFNDVSVFGNFTNSSGADGGGAFFYVPDGAEVNLNNVTITGNATIGNNSTGAGLNARVQGGGIFNVANSTVSGNATFGSNSHSGGLQIVSRGTANLTNITVESNYTNQNTSNAGGFGGTVYNGGTLNADAITITENRAGRNGGGGLLANGGGILNVTASTISNNEAGQDGGGIWNSATGTISIINSTVSGNDADDQGGGIFKTGGGILNVNYSTVTNNTSDADSNGSGEGGGLWNSASGTFSITGTIVAGNIDNSGSAPDASGAVVSRFSIIGNNTGATLTDAGGNQIGTPAAPIDPMLGPLQDNGGRTATHEPLPGSPAIDAGDPNAVAGTNGVPDFDQRGAPFRRTADPPVVATATSTSGTGAGVTGPVIDIGAVETQVVVSTQFGDYNGDGVVNTADYTVWRDTRGQTVTPFTGADGNGDGMIGLEDYAVWAGQFGTVTGLGATPATAFAASLNAVVPTPRDFAFGQFDSETSSGSSAKVFRSLGATNLRVPILSPTDSELLTLLGKARARQTSMPASGDEWNGPDGFAADDVREQALSGALQLTGVAVPLVSLW